MPSTPDTLEQQIAESMDAPEALLPLLGPLLQDMEDLGARAEDVVALLTGHAPEAGSRVLDLGCGKGAVAIALCQHYGLHVTGVDAHAPFIRHGKQRVAALELDGCELSTGDIHATIAAIRDGKTAPYEMVSLLALGDVIGDVEDTLSALRHCVRPGGLMLIDDAYLRTDLPADDSLWGDYGDRDETVENLTQYGDTLVTARVIDGPESATRYAALTAKLTARAQALAVSFPESAEALNLYAQTQCDAVAMLDGPVIGALFVLRRGA